MAFVSSHPSSFSLCPSILETYPAFLSKYTLIACHSEEASQAGGSREINGLSHASLILPGVLCDLGATSGG